MCSAVLSGLRADRGQAEFGIEIFTHLLLALEVRFFIFFELGPLGNGSKTL